MYNKYQNLKSVNDIIPLLDDDNKLVLPICFSTIKILQTYLDSKEEKYMFMDRNNSTITGLMVKIYKCFIECVDAYSKDKSEIISLYERIIYEAFIKQKYLIKHGVKVQEHYRLIAYKNRFDYYKKTNHAVNDNLNGYNSCRNTKFLELLKKDGFTLENLENNKKWKLDGKNFRQLLNDVEVDELYLSLYGISSDTIHSDWCEISQFHLIEDKNTHYMATNIEYQKSHYRQILLILGIVLSSIETYSKWLNVELDINLPTLNSLTKEIQRVNNLIFKHILNTYKDNYHKFLYD